MSARKPKRSSAKISRPGKTKGNVSRTIKMHPLSLPKLPAHGQDSVALSAIESGRTRAMDISASRAAYHRRWPRSASPGSAGVLIAKGDSWFDYPDAFSTDITKELSRNGYDTSRNDSRWGDTICSMQSSLGNVHDFIYNGLDAAPKAILLSGGGNDIVNVLATLLKPSRPGPGGWDQAAVDGFFNNTIRPAYIGIITQITTWCMAKFEKRIPTIIHGYGNPIPDDRGFPPFHAPWLGPVFVAQGYGDPYGDHQGHPILTECAPLAVNLLSYFNKMLALLPSSTDLAGVNPNVIYVDLRRELCSNLTNYAYKHSWANELHPTVPGWQQVTQRIIQALQAIP